MTITTAYVLLSGGIDSTTCLFKAFNEVQSVRGVGINYGQRHAKELVYAEDNCRFLGVQFNIIDLSHVVPKTMLTDKGSVIPKIDYAEIEGVSPTYVPFRNGLMLAAAASLASSHYEDEVVQDGEEWAIYYGAHAEDAHNWAYPDCTPEFNGAMANAIFVGTYKKIRLVTPLQWMKKHEIIRLGNELGVPYRKTWSCYAGGDEHCGECPTCRSRKEGFIRARVIDPTKYAA